VNITEQTKTAQCVRHPNSFPSVHPIPFKKTHFCCRSPIWITAFLVPLNHPKIAMTSLWRPMNHYETIIFVGYMHWNPTFGSLNFWNHNVCVLTAIKPTVFLVVHPEIILKSNEISIFPWLIQFNPIKIPSNHHWNPMKLTSFVIGHSLQSGKIMENHGSPPPKIVPCFSSHAMCALEVLDCCRPASFCPEVQAFCAHLERLRWTELSEVRRWRRGGGALAIWNSRDIMVCITYIYILGWITIDS